MSEALYDSLVEKWRRFLMEDANLWLEMFMPEDEVDDQYDNLVDDFCRKHGYSDRTKNFFYDIWWDTFGDMYYLKLEENNVKIIHENPCVSDWDFGKTFKLNKNNFSWELDQAEEKRVSKTQIKSNTS